MGSTSTNERVRKFGVYVLSLTVASVINLGGGTSGTSWTNTNGLVESSSGYAIATLNGSFIGYPFPYTDTLHITMSAIPSGLADACILGFKYRLLDCVSSAEANPPFTDKIGFDILPRDASGVSRGGIEWMHEANGTASEVGTETYLVPTGPERYSIFSNNNGALGTACNTFSDFKGFHLTGVQRNPTEFFETVTCNQILISIAYVPLDSGDTITTLTTSSTVSEVSASSAGVAVSSSWPTEVGWTNPGYAAAVEVAGVTNYRAESRGDAAHGTVTSKFLMYSIAGGQILETQTQDHPVELRFNWQASFDGSHTSNTQQSMDYL